MTVAAYIDEQYAGDVGTNGGWNRFMEWAEQNAPPDSELGKLATHGWSEDISALQSELAGLTIDEENLEQIRQALAEALTRGGVVVISDGL